MLNEEPVSEEPATPSFGEEVVEPLISSAFSAVYSLVKASESLEEIGLITQASETLQLASFISEAAKKKVQENKKEQDKKKLMKDKKPSSSSSKKPSSKKDEKKSDKKSKKQSQLNNHILLPIIFKYYG